MKKTDILLRKVTAKACFALEKAIREGSHMRIRINSAPTSLCDSCKQAVVIRGSRSDQRIVRCGAPYPTIPIPFDVKECTDFEERNSLSFHQMEEIAHVLVKKRTGEMGFRQPKSKRIDEDDE